MTRDMTGTPSGIDPVELGRLAAGRNYSDYGDSPGKRKRRPERERGGSRKRPVAQVDSSGAGQRWWDHGVSLGWDLPYDANWVALQIQDRMDHDDFMDRLRKADREPDTWRLLEKMVDLWWREYVNHEVNRKNALDYFLRVDWDDVLEYAHTSLRAAYVLEHGKPVTPPVVDPEEVQAHREKLARIEADKRFREYVGSLGENQDEVTKLDEDSRERLRSFAERTRERRKEAE